jgi:hypothetical protein
LLEKRIRLAHDGRIGKQVEATGTRAIALASATKAEALAESWERIRDFFHKLHRFSPLAINVNPSCRGILEWTTA